MAVNYHDVLLSTGLFHNDVTLPSSSLPEVENDIDTNQFQADLPTNHDSTSESQPQSNEHVAISSGDFGKVVGLKVNRKLTDHEKYFFSLTISFHLDTINFHFA